MKKILLTLAVLATVVCFSSCNKKCNCLVYVAGISTEEEFTLDELNEKFNTNYKKCSDLNTVVEVLGAKAGTDCSVTL